MVKAGIARTSMLILREAKRTHSHYSSFQAAGYDHNHQQEDQESRNRINHAGKMEGSSSLSCWVPHPRTGIYVPKGHERVMDDVPDGAASFSQTYWLRNVDGVEKPDPDLPSDHYLPSNLY